MNDMEFALPMLTGSNNSVRKVVVLFKDDTATIVDLVEFENTGKAITLSQMDDRQIIDTLEASTILGDTLEALGYEVRR